MLRRTSLLTISILLVAIPGIIHGDDTEIFGGSEINLPPNVLIIFDNSGSMGEYVTVQGSTDPWNSGTAYSGSYDRRYIYRTDNGSWWYEDVYIGSNGVVDSGEVACDDVRNTLNTYGHWMGTINTRNNYTCTGTRPRERNWRTGNYLNYLQSTGPQSRRKIDVAKETVTALIDTTSSVRFGLMIFNDSEGGRLVAPLEDRDTQASKDALKSIINGLSAQTWTPLGETLAEAGLYYSRQPSWFNTGVDYADPTTYGGTAGHHAIQWRCQKNYIIIMTDGESTQDRNSKLWDTIYLNNKVIGDYDNDVSTTDSTKHQSEYYWIDSSNVQHAYPSSGSDYLDDVAKFLYDEDLLPATVYDSSGVSFNQTDYVKQNVKTFTIGFDINHKLLSDTADTNHGQGHYFTTQDNISLSEIFERIIGSILKVNSQFVSPVVPVNRINRTYADNGIYMGIFSPDAEHPGLWKGNIKKFGYDKDGIIRDRDGAQATNSDGSIKEGARSAWVDVGAGVLEGMVVDKGGAGADLLAQSTRNFKTYKPSTSQNLVFNKTNILPADLGLLTTAERDDLVDFVSASGIYAPTATGTGSKPRQWVFGDIVHSQPAILYDRPNNRNVIFVGGNDGFLHCFIDSDHGTSDSLTDDTVEESWAFIPWDLLPNLKYLPSDNSSSVIAGDTVHDYFVDGSPVVYKSGGNTYLTFGLRRGGKNLFAGTETDNQYFMLNINNYESPSFVNSISKNVLGTEPLGQSWSTPRFCRFRTGTDLNSKPIAQDVLLLTGGYDTNQDNTDPGAADSKGRAIFAVSAAAGTGPVLLNYNHSNYDKMRYCMIDFTTYDDDGDDCEDVIYAPSVGGDLFVFTNKKNTDGTYDSTWSKKLLFKATPSGGSSSTSTLRKFMYAPGLAQETWGDFVYVGSGNREDPPGTVVLNRFYAIRNTWSDARDDSNPLTDSDLTDVSADVLQEGSMTEAEKAQSRQQLATTGYGWYFNLENTGEKIVSTPLVYNKVVYFTTFSPTTSAPSGTDRCSTGTGSGMGRLYAVNYLTGEAVYPLFHETGSTEVGTGTPTKADRSTTLGSGIPSEPTLVVTEHGTFLVVGTEKGTTSYNTNDPRSINRYFWLKQ